MCVCVCTLVCTAPVEYNSEDWFSLPTFRGSEELNSGLRACMASLNHWDILPVPIFTMFKWASQHLHNWATTTTTEPSHPPTAYTVSIKSRSPTLSLPASNHSYPLFGLPCLLPISEVMWHLSSHDLFPQHNALRFIFGTGVELSFLVQGSIYATAWTHHCTETL